MNRVNHRLIETRTRYERERATQDLSLSLSLVVARCLSLARISSLHLLPPSRNHLVARD